MLAEERFSQILALLAEKRTATVQELCEALNVSESTIRRDLLELDRQGRVNKVHGGATLPNSQFRADEPTMEAKETLAVSQKNTIAKATAALIQADDFVYLDAGSTTLAVARAVSGAALDAHYVTNGIAHALLERFGSFAGVLEASEEELCRVPGVGPATSRALMAHFKTVSAVKEASEEQLAGAKGVSRAAARAVYAHFHPQPEQPSAET